MHWSVPLKQAFKHTISWKEALSQNKKELSTELRKQKRFVLGHNKDLDWESPPSPPSFCIISAYANHPSGRFIQLLLLWKPNDYTYENVQVLKEHWLEKRHLVKSNFLFTFMTCSEDRELYEVRSSTITKQWRASYTAELIRSGTDIQYQVKILSRCHLYGSHQVWVQS